LLSAILSAAGVTPDRADRAFSVVDKLEREGSDRSLEKLETQVGLERKTAENVLALFTDPTLEAVHRLYGDREEVRRASEPLAAYVAALDAMGLGDFVEVDLRIVRGLAYYTGIVFELFDRKGALRAICGGGRYDNLLARVGGESLPAVGFGMGDVVLGELLQERGLRPAGSRHLDYFIVVVGDEQRPAALSLAHRLRDRGLSVAYALRDQPVRKQFAAAGSEGAREVIILGPDEVRSGLVVVRDMSSGEERKVALEALSEPTLG
jgi:histidyl-tRNA synthetase